MQSVSTSGGERADHGISNCFASSRRPHALSPPLPKLLTLFVVLEQRCQLFRQFDFVGTNLHRTTKKTALPKREATGELRARTRERQSGFSEADELLCCCPGSGDTHLSPGSPAFKPTAAKEQQQRASDPALVCMQAAAGGRAASEPQLLQGIDQI